MFTLNQLEMFKLVADTGSFNKAAEKAYVTANAVMKQVNNLEKELDVMLFVRTFRGQQLTLAGEALYKRIQPLFSMCDDIVAEVKEAAEHDINKIKAGTSVMTPLEPLDSLWEEIRERYPNIKIQIVTFDNDSIHEKGTAWPMPGTKVDFLIDSYDDAVLNFFDAKACELSKVGMHAVVSVEHRLASRKSINMEDLEHETIIRKRKGRIKYVDEFCEELDNRHIEVTYHDVGAYSTDAYNACVENGCVMLGIGNIRNVHPFLKRIPINYDKKCSFGIVYSNDPTPAVKKFISVIETILSEKEGSTFKMEND